MTFVLLVVVVRPFIFVVKIKIVSICEIKNRLTKLKNEKKTVYLKENISRIFVKIQYKPG